jgi:hypothetical protein
VVTVSVASTAEQRAGPVRGGCTLMCPIIQVPLNLVFYPLLDLNNLKLNLAECA